MIIVIGWPLSGIPLLVTIGVVKSILLLKNRLDILQLVQTSNILLLKIDSNFVTCAKDQIDILLLKILSRFLVKNFNLSKVLIILKQTAHHKIWPTNWLYSAVYWNRIRKWPIFWALQFITCYLVWSLLYLYCNSLLCSFPVACLFTVVILYSG